jgi:hypothetical protein
MAGAAARRQCHRSRGSSCTEGARHRRLEISGPFWIRQVYSRRGALHDHLLSVQAEAGCRSSAGIACNKMLAKLASGLHKPDDQTILPPSVAAAFIAPLPVRCSTLAKLPNAARS